MVYKFKHFKIIETTKFEFENGTEVRVIPVMENETSWFVATDVCNVLDIADTSQAMERLDEDEKRLMKIQDKGQMRDTWLISESGLYAIVFTSVKSNAKIFRKWVTSEVLPSIRKTGKYTTAQEQERQAKMKMLTKNINKVDEKIEQHKREIRRLSGIKEKLQKELIQYINEDINQLSFDFVI